MMSPLTFEQLVDFLERGMSMSHVYQPVLIRALIEAGGAATVRQLAQVFLAEDESQLQFYERRIREMPLRVLSKHGVVAREGELIRLNAPPLDFRQRARLKLLCEQRLQRFLEQRGLALWDYRLLEIDPVPDNLRFQVLKDGGGRCALCGATKEERPLDVDHIIPRSRRGTNDRSNLQVLCSKCNRTKGNQDTTDYRGMPIESDPGCTLCPPEQTRRTVAEHGSVVAIEVLESVATGHHLVLPRRHTQDYFSMTRQERVDADDLLRVLRGQIQERDRTVVGFKIEVRCGEAAGQTIPHASAHLIPCWASVTQKGDG